MVVVFLIACFIWPKGAASSEALISHPNINSPLKSFLSIINKGLQTQLKTDTIPLNTIPRSSEEFFLPLIKPLLYEEIKKAEYQNQISSSA